MAVAADIDLDQRGGGSGGLASNPPDGCVAPTFEATAEILKIAPRNKSLLLLFFRKEESSLTY
jgi:hypothetical protein